MPNISFSCSLLMALLTSLASFANYNSGVSSAVGNMYPANDASNIHFNRQIIQLRGLDTSVNYTILYEFENTKNDYQTVEAITPVRIYFTDFKPGSRSVLLETMATYFPDLFRVDDPYSDIRDQIKQKFGKRLFVRKYVSSLDLSRIGIFFSMQQGDEKQYARKIFIEFRWVEEEIGGKNYTEALLMDIKISSDILFRPQEKTNLITRLNLPTLITGTREKQVYAPYQLIHKNRWGQHPEDIYIIHDVFDASLTLPTYLSYERYPVNQHDMLTLVRNYEPGMNDKIAFYSRKSIEVSCGDETLYKEYIYIPPAIKNIKASSWYTGSKVLGDRNITEIKQLTLSNVIREFQSPEQSELYLFQQELQDVRFDEMALNRYLVNVCEGDNVSLELNDYCHPVYAFMMSQNSGGADKQVGVPLNLQTAWCEDASGDGTGEYLEFELTQPAKAFRIYNGYQISDYKYEVNSRLKAFEIKQVDGDFSAKFPVSDLKILNLYEVYLEPGTYRLTIRGAHEGKYPVSCISGIYFDFETEDDWFNRNFAMMTGRKNP